MTLNEAFYQLRNSLAAFYSEREAVAIAHEVMAHITRLSKIDRLIEKDRELDTLQQNELEYMQDELSGGKPLQYVTGKAWFLDREFLVDEQVLIPRPETEELVIWVLNEQRKEGQNKGILDIGTGSGCIPISLKLEWPEAAISACDISEGALALAQQNAARHDAPVRFFRQDILDETLWNLLPAVDVIVSNPPYIPRHEAAGMDDHVTLFEPHLALFVPDDNYLLFYRKIAMLGKRILNKGGAVYCELHRDFPEETKAVFATAGYAQIELRKDMHDNWRMIRAMI